MDVCCECAASLIYSLLLQGWLIQLVSFGAERQVQSGSGPLDFQRFYHWLACVPFDGHLSFSSRLAAEPANRFDAPAIFLITSDLNPELLNTLARLHRDRRSVHTLFAGSGPDGAAESILAGLMNQAGFPAWFIHYGENLADILQKSPL
ncbi:MAG TPA: hypothetical protein DD640_00665 [Clostridiales bacterium]|nr:hypothetical protein [Clostridiales bacterium]